jgi:hypothetical protein
MASILIFFFKQGKIFRETRTNGNNFKIVNNRQPLKNFNLQDTFLRCSQCSAAAAVSEEY